MNSGIYTTLGKDGRASLEIQKSVFIASSKHVTTEKEATDFINSVKKEFSDARHNVYAYTLKEGNITRYSDDGEPQGTGGLPVLDYIRKTGFTDCVVVVTRYFGGILLGKGGLVRAYTGAAQAACSQSGIVSFEKYNTFSLICDYSYLDKIRYEFPLFKVIEDSCDYSDRVKLELAVKENLSDDFSKRLSELFSGKLTLENTGSRFDVI